MKTNKLPYLISLAACLLLLTACAGPPTLAIPTLAQTDTPVPTPVMVTATLVPTTPAPPTAVPPTAVPPTPTFPPTSTQVPVTSAAVRIKFAAGATSGSVEGELQPGQTQDFLVGASAQQPLLVSTGSLNNDVTFSIKGQTDGKTLSDVSQKLTSWQTMLTVTQDYLIHVSAGASTEKFTLNVITPARITFAPGAVSAKETGTTPGGLIVSYILRASANQTMDITLDASNLSALLSVYGFQDGQPYLRSVVGSQKFNMKLPATQDYVIQVVPNAGQVASYTLNITVK